MNKNNIMQIVEDIIKSADELKAKKDLTEGEYGELIAYAETLCIIQDACAGYDLSEIGLDFDVDEKYLL